MWIVFIVLHAISIKEKRSANNKINKWRVSGYFFNNPSHKFRLKSKGLMKLLVPSFGVARTIDVKRIQKGPYAEKHPRLKILKNSYFSSPTTRREGGVTAWTMYQGGLIIYFGLSICHVHLHVQWFLTYMYYTASFIKPYRNPLCKCTGSR